MTLSTCWLWIGGALLVGAAVLLVPVVRRSLLSRLVFAIMKKIIPPISKTERVALDAGVVWNEGELFSGAPNIKKLMQVPYAKLSAEEQAFMDGPVNKLCGLLSDWQLWKQKEIPPQVMQYIKDEGFFGLCVPKKYGGLGFSNYLHSEVIKRLASRSVGLTITVMVPNSLGPAELLLHYGTDAQKNKWLPGLARGKEIPCFGLTEAQAGSDAGAIESHGVLFKGDDGKIYMRLEWRKRWITLAAISTLVGLAFKLRDPDNLLGRGEDLGITCALIPANTKGVVLGRRHDPLGVPFYNCPTEGHDVVLDAEQHIIGGLKGAGGGWAMLMESLGAGRGISLPSQSAGISALAARVTSAHCVVRRQFGNSLGKFEGLQEPLARIASKAYMIEALRCYTVSALDQGIKPPVATAMAKCYATELGREVVQDAMDILGGTGISMGPRNLMAVPFISSSIGITVEGANIMTRTFMIFGQGAMRAHPYVYKQVKACEQNNLVDFDKAFWGHMWHITKNKMRSGLYLITRAYAATRGRGQVAAESGRYVQKLTWASANFAILADVTMAFLGGRLKQKEKLAGRYADMLSWMYIVTAMLRRFEHDGRKKEHLPVFNYSMKYAFSQIQQAMEGIFKNFEGPWLFRVVMRNLHKWIYRMNAISTGPDDQLGVELARAVQKHGPLRDAVTQGVYMPPTGSLDIKAGGPTSEGASGDAGERASESAGSSAGGSAGGQAGESSREGVADGQSREQLWHLENVMREALRADALERKVKQAARRHKWPRTSIEKMAARAQQEGVLTEAELKQLQSTARLRREVIQVDDFSQSEYLAWGPPRA